MDVTSEIVVGADSSESGLAAVRWAADTAARRGCRLRLVAVMPRWAWEMPDEGRHAEVGRWAREDAAQVLDQVRGVAAERRPEVEIETELVPGEVKSTLVERIDGAELAVVGTRGSGGFVDLLVGSVALTVAAKAGCPTIVVREWDGDEVAQRVLVALDLADPAAEILEFGAQEARRRNAELHLVAAVRRISDIVGGASGEHLCEEDAWYLEQGEEGPRQVLARVVDELAARHEGLEITTELRAGHPVAVVSHLSRGADLVVMGRRRTRQTPLGLGSVTRGVLARSQCPVAVVPVSRPTS